MFRRFTYILVSLLLVLVCSGCPGGGGEKKPAPQKGPKIGVSVADMQRDGNQVMKKIFDKAKKQDKAQIAWMDAKGDPNQQMKDIQKLIEEKVKAVILQVTDPSAAPDMVRQLAQNNIKVIALETLPLNTPVDAYITSDHSRTGELQVKYLQTLFQEAQQKLKQGDVVLNPQVPKQGGQQNIIIPSDQQAAVGLQDGRPMKVVVLQGDSNDQMAREITAAVNSSLQKIENIDVVVSQPHPRWDANLAKSTMQQILSGKQKIDAVLANDSSLAVAAVEVLKQFGMERRVITVGAGAASKAVQAIMSGEHDAEIDNRPDMLAMAAYDAAVAMAQGRAFDYDIMVNNGDYTVPAKVVPPRLVQQDNVYLVQDRVEKKEQQDKDQQQNQNQQQQQQGQMGGQQQTTLRITTSEGKVVEVQIEGEVQSIQSQTGGMQQGQQ